MDQPRPGARRVGSLHLQHSLARASGAGHPAPGAVPVGHVQLGAGARLRVSVGGVVGYMQSRVYDILSSVDPAGEHWGMYCPCLPPYQWCASRYIKPIRQVPLAQRRIHVHAKTIIVDDVWATIGSANMNVRSYTNDAEVNACFIDGQVDDRGLHVSVRDYRAKLWAEHFDVAEDWFRDRPGNAPEVIQYWKDTTVERDPRNGEGAGFVPTGPRLYVWPHSEVYVDRTDVPSSPGSWLGCRSRFSASPSFRCTGGWSTDMARRPGLPTATT